MYDIHVTTKKTANLKSSEISMIYHQEAIAEVALIAVKHVRAEMINRGYQNCKESTKFIKKVIQKS